MKPLRTVILAKAPRSGQVKTRLIPALGPQGAAALARRMIEHTVTQALAADIGEVELCRAPEDDPSWSGLDLPAGLLMSDQGEGDLGERMARASRRVVEGGQAVLLIGTDCPALTPSRLRDIHAAMVRSDSVMVPATDGGYVALGLHRFHPQVFSNITWSTQTVAAVTLRRLQDLGWSVRQLSPEHDIDEPADLRHLPRGWSP